LLVSQPTRTTCTALSPPSTIECLTHPGKYPADENESKCHISVASYPLTDTGDLADSSTADSACAGATISNATVVAEGSADLTVTDSTSGRDTLSSSSTVIGTPAEKCTDEPGTAPKAAEVAAKLSEADASQSESKSAKEGNPPRKTKAGHKSVPVESTGADGSKADSLTDDADVAGKTAAKSQKKPPAWLDRWPFSVYAPTVSGDFDKNYIYSSELTWQERWAYYREYLREYLTETKLCVPYMKRLFLVILRVSPWRVAALIALNLISGLLPALGLQTKGRFVMMARLHSSS
jgi:hypothetical protein